MNTRGMSGLYCAVLLCTLASPILAVQNWNDEASITVKKVNGWDERGEPHYTPQPDAQQKLDSAVDADKYDVIIAKKPADATTITYRRADAFQDPVDDGALFFHIAAPGGAPNYPTLPAGAVLVRVERRNAIGAIYWVEVKPSLTGSNGSETPTWWGVEVDTANVSGALMLKDTNGGNAVVDYAAGDPSPPAILGCDIAADDKGDITFSLNQASGSYTWTIAPDVPGDDTATWTQAPYDKTVNNIAPGEYTLTVTGAGGFERKIQFVVVKITLTAPTEDQNFAIAMAGPTMPTVALTATVTPNMAGLEYSFTVGNPATGRALEYVDAPTSGYTHPSLIESPWVSTNTWNIVFGDSIYGGNVTHVTVSIRKTDFEYSRTLSRSFYIVGGSLTGALRNGYIDTLTTVPANIRTMVKAIAMQESGGTHYWPTGYGIGTASHNRYPLREPGGGGYGVMQLTSPSLLNRDTIWNWKENIDMGIAKITSGYNAGETMLNTHAAGVNDAMKRLEGYSRYNGLPGYYYWKAPNGPWTIWGYIAGPKDNNFGLRDYNNDGLADPAGNPYNLTYFTGAQPAGENTNLRPISSRYADRTKTLEP